MPLAAGWHSPFSHISVDPWGRGRRTGGLVLPNNFRKESNKQTTISANQKELLKC